MKKLPFKETTINGVTYRKFNTFTDPNDLKWHWDEEDRVVYPTHSTDWQFQYDNQLPFKLNKPIIIKKGVFHRLIKGSGCLILGIIKKK